MIGNRTHSTTRIDTPSRPGKLAQIATQPFQYQGIAISGKIASGKTTLAQALMLDYGLPVLPLAACLKEDVCEALHRSGLAELPEDIILKHKPDMRGLLQDWGKLFRKLNGEDYWIDKLFSYAHQHHHRYFIVDDLRFRNEFDAMRARHFLTVRLDISWPTQESRLAKLYPDTPLSQLQHASEIELDSLAGEFDILVPAATIKNGKTAAFVRDRLRHFDLAWVKPDILES